MSHDATTGAVSIEVVIPSSSINSGTWKVYGIFDGDPNSEDLLTSGTFGACLGAPGVGAYCADVLFIGVRGSGQTASDAGGYGNELNYVRAGIVSYMPSNKQVEAVALDYTAASVPSLFAPRGGITNFFASIDNGVTLLRERLRYAQIACGDQKVVLAGYSQGALVVNMVARNARNVVGVLLVADPGRVPNQASRNLGSARSGSGIYRLTGIDLGRISTPRNARVVELCNARDIICDWSNAGVPRAALTGAATAPAAVSFATGVHMAYPATASNQLIELGREGVLAAGLIPRP
jgi:pimeloyl-ACP methyl ester carboxylesterase